MALYKCCYYHYYYLLITNFCQFSGSIAGDDIGRFVKALTDAERYEVEKADIILCTCSTAGAPRLTHKFSRTWSDNSNLVCIFFTHVEHKMGGA